MEVFDIDELIHYTDYRVNNFREIIEGMSDAMEMPEETRNPDAGAYAEISSGEEQGAESTTDESFVCKHEGRLYF